MPALAPLVIDVTRGPAVESSHIVHGVLMDGDGKTIAAYGDARRLTYPRSSLKPLQALAMVEGGAAEKFGLSEAEVALACASHSGEEKHTAGVAAWLQRLGLDEKALECGAHAPYAAPCAPATVLCNNCSGKHTGMLTLARFMGAPEKGYTDFGHPAQLKMLELMAGMCGEPLTPAVCGVDGCSAPNPAMPLEAFARGFARFMNPASSGDARQAACKRIFAAMTAHPDLVAGTGRIDTILMAAAKGRIMSKGGGEAVTVLVVPDKNTVAVLKCEDGAHRATQAALYAILERHRLADADTLAAVRPVACPVLKNWRGLETGRIEARKQN